MMINDGDNNHHADDKCKEKSWLEVHGLVYTDGIIDARSWIVTWIYLKRLLREIARISKEGVYCIYPEAMVYP